MQLVGFHGALLSELSFLMVDGTSWGKYKYIYIYMYPGIKTMDVNITTIDYLRVLIIEIGSTIILNGGGSPGYIHIFHMDN